MTLKFTESYGKWPDGVYWRCNNKFKNNNKKLVNCDRTQSIRVGTFFHKSHLNIIQIMIFVHLWCKHVEIGVAAEEADISSSRTAADWNSFCREVVLDHCFTKSTKIGKK